MKSIIKLILIPAIAAVTISTGAFAQRGYHRDYNRYNNRPRSYYYRPQVVIAPRYFSYPRFNALPRSSVSIVFGGNPYYYSGGSYYRPFNGFYHRVTPPIGLQIGILPTGFMPVMVGANQYYFSEGIYYRRADRNYEVVDAPMGAQISSLPTGAKSVVVNGEKFYELNGSYYKQDRNYKGENVYTVVGKNGEIDNTEQTPLVATPSIGDKVAQLPPDCKTITLNGEKLFVAPNDTYYKAEQDGHFTIVGMASR
jgi:hypothetical protein